MATNLPKNSWIDQVINFGVDKTIPFGVVNIVISKDTGNTLGFVRDGQFYELGTTPAKQVIKKSTTSGFSINDLNKELPNGGINISQVKDYLNSDDPKLADAARKILALQSLGIWDMSGNPTTKTSETGGFGKIAVTNQDVKAALDKANEAKQKAATQDYESKKAANNAAQSAGKALPYPNLPATAPATQPIESIQGFKPTTTSGQVDTTNIREGRVGATSTTPAAQAGGTTPTSVGTLVTDKKNPAGAAATVPSGAKPSTTPKVKSSTKTAADATITTTPSDSQIAEFQAKYGVQAALVNSDPSLKSLFDQAVKENWSADRFKAEFLNTDWAKTHAESWQQSERARLSAPATYADSYNRMRTLIAQTAVSQGITLSPDQLGPEATTDKVHNRTGNIVEWALDQSWGKGLDTQALKTHIAELGKINTALPGGSAFDYASQLRSYAYDNGLSNLTLAGGQDYFNQAAQSILLGKSDLNTWKADILKTAKQNYGAFAAQLDAGMTMRAIAAPYINTLANLLEISPEQVNLGDTTGYGKMVTDALRGTDPANPKPTPLYDFEKIVKANPAWAYTNNARNTVLGGVGGLLRTLGKVS